MAKAMLIMDMPTTCAECCACNEFGYCEVEREFCLSRFDKKQEWCPLRRVPQKKDGIGWVLEKEHNFIKGYNACIDEILGGGE